jgi:hypothetical protein
VAWLARLSGERGDSPQIADPMRTRSIRLRMQTIGSGGGGSVYAKVDMCIEVVGSPVGEIE